jgi:trehalose 6-phosphate phosphatase
MIGDDVGDESALLAAEQMGGLGLRVAGEHFATAVSDFDSTRSVRLWLETLSTNLRAADKNAVPA